MSKFTSIIEEKNVYIENLIFTIKDFKPIFSNNYRLTALENIINSI